MIRDEKLNVTELAARIRLAQEIQITNGPIVAVMEGREGSHFCGRVTNPPQVYQPAPQS